MLILGINKVKKFTERRHIVRSIEFQLDGYEIVVEILNDEGIYEADVYYKDFETYKIYVLANTERQLIEIGTNELLTKHPFETVIKRF